MTQQNAALVEEAASASESMEEQAKGLIKLMEFFNVGDSSESGGFAARVSKPAAAAPAAPKATRAAAPAPTKRRPASNNNDDDEWSEF